MTDQKLICSIFPKYENIQALSPEKIDTISSKFFGKYAVIPYKVVDASGERHYIMIKHKNSLVVPLGATLLSPSFGIFLKVIRRHCIFGFNSGGKREKLFYEKIDNSLRGALPQFLGSCETFKGQRVSLAMIKFSQGREVVFSDLYKVIDLITDFHAKYYGKRETIREMRLNYYTPKEYRRSSGVLRALFNYYYDENVKIYGKELVKVMSDFIGRIDEEYAKVMEYQTLTHNDLTPRNISIGERIIIYDWELACFQNPEHDLVELLFTTVDNDCTPEQIRKIINYFRKQLTNKTKTEISDEEFARRIRFNALEYVVNRLAIFRSYSKKNHNKLARRCERNARKVLEACL